VNLGRLEILLGVLVLAGLGYLGVGFTRGRTVDMCTPLPLSQEVKAYIDSKIAATSEGACGEIPTMITKLADLETKMGAIDAYRVSVAQRETKKAEYQENSETLRTKTVALLQKERENEVNRIKNEIGSICAQAGGGSASSGGGGLGRRGRFQNNNGNNTPPPSIPGVGDDSKDSKPGSDGK
jgi:hypothetical protein